MGTILNLLDGIAKREIVLPAIQRDFVWEEDAIVMLLDSIMRGYPIGLALLWESYHDIQHRPFATDPVKNEIYEFRENQRKERLKLVLDGQQRLQSLFIALHGTLNGKSLYFDVLSGIAADNSSNERYVFKFLGDDEARKLNLGFGGARRQDKGGRFAIKVDPGIKVGDVVEVFYSEELTKSRHLEHEDVYWGAFPGVVTKIAGNPPALICVHFSYEDETPSHESVIDVANGLELSVNLAVADVKRSSTPRAMLDNWYRSNGGEGDMLQVSRQYAVTLPAGTKVGDVLDLTYDKRMTEARGLEHYPVQWKTVPNVLLEVFGDPPEFIRVRYSGAEEESQILTIDLTRGVDVEYNAAVTAIRRSDVTKAQMDEWHSTSPSPLVNSEGQSASHFEKVMDLFRKDARERRELRQQLIDSHALSESDLTRFEDNVIVLKERLSEDTNILQVAVIDDRLPQDSPKRKTESDVIEIFARVNTQGTALSRADLIFSMLKLNWQHSALALPEFVKEVNKGNDFDIDVDFVIRCLLAVSDLGTKFNEDILRKKINVSIIEKNFGSCCDAIRSTLDFVQNSCWCSSSKVLGGTSTLVPFVYYLFHSKDHQVPNAAISDVRKSLYLLALSRTFSRYAANRLNSFIRDEIKPVFAAGRDGMFPYARTMRRVAAWENIESVGEGLLASNISLTLQIVQGQSGATAQYGRNKAQIDHIFPRAGLERKGYREERINHFANFWLLEEKKNNEKRDGAPRKWFSNYKPEELERALIDLELLEYSKYREFLRVRSAKMLERVKQKIGFTDADFHVDDSEEPKETV